MLSWRCYCFFPFSLPNHAEDEVCLRSTFRLNRFKPPTDSIQFDNQIRTSWSSLYSHSTHAQKFPNFIVLFRLHLSSSLRHFFIIRPYVLSSSFSPHFFFFLLLFIHIRIFSCFLVVVCLHEHRRVR